MPTKMPHNAESVAAGRGGLALSGAKVYFLVIGLAQQIALSWLLKDSYGALRGAQSPASIIYNPMVTGGVQGLSRNVSQGLPSRPALLMHLVGSIAIAAGFYWFAPDWGDWDNSRYLVRPVRALSLVILFYGLYAPIVGILNGRRRFLAQAGLDALAATLRTLGLFFGAWLCLGTDTSPILGANLGFAAAALVMLLVAAVVVVTQSQKKVSNVIPQASAPGAYRAYLGFVLPVLGSQLLINLLLQTDTNTLRAFATRAAERSGMNASAADALVGAYNAGQLFAFLPYQLLMGVTFMLFPLLAKAEASGDRAATRRYVKNSNRIALIVVGAAVSVSAGLAPQLLQLVFPENFAVIGAESMRVLCCGLGVFALFGIQATVLNSIGRQWETLLITFLAFTAVLLTNILLVSGVHFGSSILLRTAIATSLGISLAFGACLLRVRAHTGGAFPFQSVVRVTLCAAVCVCTGISVPNQMGKLGSLLLAVVWVLAYGSLLVITRELTKRDLAYLLHILGRRLG